MSSDNVAIRISHLSKKYQIGGLQEPYHTLRDAIVDSLKAPLMIFHRDSPDKGFWALKDVSFDVEQGEVVGIIGRNGAGKSTLLKILSRITSPTEGTVEIHGRIGSLLEVGTGFHPEMTGRENIFLNGSILGMKKIEIEEKFDEIVKFSEIDKFIDTPVKRYSSGMYIRLAFAVAAYLETEILAVDEVLAVGDIKFQKKCLGKMKTISKEGRTVLFVSHNMGMITSLCHKGILLDNGMIKSFDDITHVVNTYYNNNESHLSKIDFSHSDKIPGDECVKLISAKVADINGESSDSFLINQNIVIEMEYLCCRDNLQITPHIYLYNHEGTRLFMSLDTTCDPHAEKKQKHGKYRSKCIIPGNLLNDGTFFISLGINSILTSESHVYLQNILSFMIIDPIDDVVTRGIFGRDFPGTIRPALLWDCEYISQ